MGSHKDGLNDQQMGIGDEPLNEQGHADKKDLKEGKALRGELLHCGEEVKSNDAISKGHRGQVWPKPLSTIDNYLFLFSSLFFLGYEFLL